jgi:hypothetical protein
MKTAKLITAALLASATLAACGGPAKPPVANNDTASSLKTDEVVIINVANNDTGEGKLVTGSIDLDLTTAGQQKVFVVADKGTFELQSDGTIKFTPETGFTGDITIQYTIQNEDNQTSNTATITVTIGDYELGTYSEVKANLLATGSKLLDFGKVMVEKASATLQAFGSQPNLFNATNYSSSSNLVNPRETDNTNPNRPIYIQKLPRYTYDCSTTCPSTIVASDDFIGRWKTPSGEVAEMIFDWDGSSAGTAKAPVKVATATSSSSVYVSEIPVNVVVTFKVGSKIIFSGAASGAFRPLVSEAGLFTLNPANATLKAFAETLDGTARADINAFKLDFNDGVKFELDAAVKVNSDQAKLKIKQQSSGDVTIVDPTTGNGYNSGTYVSGFGYSLNGFKPKGAFESNIRFDYNGDVTSLFDKGTTDVGANGMPKKISVSEARFVASKKRVVIGGSVQEAATAADTDTSKFTFKDGDKKATDILRDVGAIR